ncbi:DUF4397 domain-containing protein [Algoriphagus halophytocola]|uniref:DUF4397 domain-containing protein n=1 Tax=Algoriphagus halophytocola TaxID=2991499 RepID=A0ABY6MH15_9BACT|nr:DUF4397 domain-containing protein [Algoriphagus sp. TR-M5]UZD23082.1 DUF4397 domain-containing protein [Algoriphagus sp. TR-M5]
MISVKDFAFKKLRTFATLALLGGTLGLTSCLDDNDIAQVPDSGYISIYNGAPDSPGLIISTDVRDVNNFPLKYSQTLSYNSYFPGERPFFFSEQYSVTTLFEKEFTVKVDSVYSMYIIQDGEELDAFLVDDDWAEPNESEAQIRFLNLSPDAGNVTVVFNESETPLFSSTGFKGNTSFENVDQDLYDIEVLSESGEVLVSANDVSLLGNRVFTLILKGYAETTDADKKLDLQLLTNYINY